MRTRSPSENDRQTTRHLASPPCSAPGDRPAQPDGHVEEWRLPGTDQSVARARSLLRLRLAELAVPEDTADNMVLVLSELATNAAVHSRSAGRNGFYRVRLYHGATLLRLAVTDAGGFDAPRVRRDAPSCLLTENGRGLLLVEHFATRWWTRSGPDGRTVYAEFPPTG